MFTRSRPKSAAMAETTSQVRREGNGAPSIISAGVAIKGDLTSPGDIQLDGTLEGDIRCVALTVGESGRVKGTVRADTVVVRGEIVGTVFAKMVRLDKSARVSGDLTQRSIAIEAGATITGHIIHKEKPLDSEAGNTTAGGNKAPLMPPESRPRPVTSA